MVTRLSLNVSSAANRREGEEDDNISVQTVEAGNVRGALLYYTKRDHSATSNTTTLFGAHLIMFYLSRTTASFSKSHQSTKTFTKGAKCYMITDLT